MNNVLSAEVVEIQIDSTGKFWVNINGQCALCIGHAEYVKVDFLPKKSRRLTKFTECPRAFRYDLSAKKKKKRK
jgi:hypothetical protein